MDSTSQDISSVLDKTQNIQNVVFGLPKEYFQEGLDDKIKKTIEKIVEKLNPKELLLRKLVYLLLLMLFLVIILLCLLK